MTQIYSLEVQYDGLADRDAFINSNIELMKAALQQYVKAGTITFRLDIV